MKKLFIIGGMGAGKSTARKALVEQGLPNIDLDQVGHDVLLWDTVKSELVETFGEDILGADGEIDRRALAAKAFVSPAETRSPTAWPSWRLKATRPSWWSIRCSRTARRRSLTTPTW